MANKLYNETSVQNIANAIRTKNGSADTYTIGEMANAILAIPSGGSTLQTKSVTINQNGTTTVTPDTGYDGMDEVQITTNVSGSEVEEKDVNFYDYDGTRLYSYSAQEFANLSELPANPTHSGLTAQGWNWTLAGAKTYVATNGKLDIGQMYVTTDGKTKLYVEIQEYKKHVYVGFGIKGTATIDWGDGSTSSVTGSSDTTVVYGEHTYSQTGEYVITITSSVNIKISGTSNTGSYLFTEKYSAVNQNRAVLNSVKKIELGSNVQVLDVYSFSFMPSLETITMPSSITTINTNVFHYCNSLKFCVIPIGPSGIPIQFFSNCYSMTGVSLSEGCSTMGNYAFQNCYNLKRLVIPSGSTVLGTYLCQNCYSLEEAIIPEGINSLASYDFQNCYILEPKLPNSTVNLGMFTFSGAYKMKGMIFPSNVTSFLTSVFATCVSAVYFECLGNITSIATNAFSQCASVECFDFTHCTAVPTLAATSAFSNSVNASFIVPDDLYSTWKSASNWSTYASQIIKESDWNG